MHLRSVDAQEISLKEKIRDGIEDPNGGAKTLTSTAILHVSIALSLISISPRRPDGMIDMSGPHSIQRGRPARETSFLAVQSCRTADVLSVHVK